MNGSYGGAETLVRLVERVGARLAAADRGWKATLLGVVIVLAVAVGL